MAKYDENIQKSLEFIVKNQNQDGGWGYRIGGMSYTEPTTMALLALFHPLGVARTNPSPTRASAVNKAMAWLRATQHSDGGWGVFQGDDISGWMTFPTVWMLNNLLATAELKTQFAKAEDKDARDKGRNWIIVNAVPTSSDTDFKLAKRYYNIDADLLSWGWQSGDVGWVIPTALAMIALTVEDRTLMADSEQIRNCKAFLRNRACFDFGWNAGLPYLLDKPMTATADATAYALLAYAITRGVSDFGQTKPFERASDVLYTFLDKTNSDQTLALGLLALRFYRDEDDKDFVSLFSKLIKGASTPEKPIPTSIGQDKNTGGWSRSPYTTALAVLALTQGSYFFGTK